VRQRPSRHILIVVENSTLPLDRRVWLEATTLQDAGYRVTVISPKALEATASHEVLDGIVVYRHPTVGRSGGRLGFVLEFANALLWQFLLVMRVLLQGGFDAIHACNPPDTIFVVGGFFKLLGKRFVFDHHDLSPELYEAKFGGHGRLWHVLLFLERMTFRTADVSIATNESYRLVAIERGGMDPHRVFVVRNGPKLEFGRDARSAPELKRGRPYLVGYAGSLGTQDTLDHLLDAAHHIVRDLGREVQFVVAGPGPELPRLKRRAQELGIGDYVTFTGYLSQAELVAALSTADVCIGVDGSSALNEQSTMIKITEYMALGKPIVQFDLREGRVSAQGASLYARPDDPIELGDKVVSLLDDAARRAEMGALGRRRVEEELAWEHQAPKLLEAYASLWPDDRDGYELDRSSEKPVRV
jgi:glycosyltransferase involved in cell wall biosynthesis